MIDDNNDDDYDHLSRIISPDAYTITQISMMMVTIMTIMLKAMKQVN